MQKDRSVKKCLDSFIYWVWYNNVQYVYRGVKMSEFKTGNTGKMANGDTVDVAKTSGRAAARTPGSIRGVDVLVGGAAKAIGSAGSNAIPNQLNRTNFLHFV